MGSITKRSPLPWIVLLLAIVLMAVPVGALWPRYQARSRRVDPAAIEAMPGLADAPEPVRVAATLPRAPGVPKLRAPEGTEEQPEDERTDGDELSAAEREQLERWEGKIRGQALAEAGLNEEEAAKAAAVREKLDAQRARFETQIDPDTGWLYPAAAGAVRFNARAERRELDRALGASRAAALAKAQSDSMRRLLADEAEGATTARPAVKRMLARRTLPGAPRAPITRIRRTAGSP